MGWILAIIAFAILLAIPAYGLMHQEKVHKARASRNGPNDPYASS